MWNVLFCLKKKWTKMNCYTGIIIDALGHRTLWFQILIYFPIPSRGLLQKTWSSSHWLMTWLFLYLGNCIKRSGWSNIFWAGCIKCAPALSDSQEAFPHTICSPTWKIPGDLRGRGQLAGVHLWDVIHWVWKGLFVSRR